MIRRPNQQTGRHKAARSRHLDGQRGSSPLELVVVFPVVLLILFGIVQGALFYYARSTALAAAQEGSRAAGAETGTAGVGQQTAAEFVDRVAGHQLLQTPQIKATRTATTATVTITGQSLSLLPGIDGWHITQTASVPAERITGGAGA